MYEVTTASAPAVSSLRGRPRRAAVSEIATTVSPGANRAASLAQFGTTLVGATMRNGGEAGLGLPGVADQGQRLDGLAEAHVVGEDAAEPVLP